MKTDPQKILSCLPLSKWIHGDYWMKIPPIRKTVLLISLLHSGSLRRQGILRKTAEIDRLLFTLLSHGAGKELFSKNETIRDTLEVLQRPLNSSGIYNRKRSSEGRKRNIVIAVLDAVSRQADRFLVYLAGESPSFLVPAQGLSSMVRAGMAALYSESGKERYFDVEDLASIEETLARHGQAPGERTFTRTAVAAAAGDYPGDMKGRMVPESNIRHYFPGFAPDEFIRRGARFKIMTKRLFSVEEIDAVASYLEGKLLSRDRESRVQRTVLALKKTALVSLLLFIALPLSVDLGLALYGLTRNDYFHGSLYRADETLTMRTPYAERANRIYRMNRSAGYSGFNLDGQEPEKGMLFRFVNDGSIAVDLGYASYRGMRIADQNGLTIVFIDRGVLEAMAGEGDKVLRPVLDRVLDLSVKEKLFRMLDDMTGNRFQIFKPGSFGYERISGDILKKISGSPRPLQWINTANGARPFITVVYHRANTRKWAGLDSIPAIMQRAVVLREDRRFYNGLFPLPHRGNDLPVIVPQMVKKAAHDVLVSLHSFGAVHDIAWIRDTLPSWIGSLRKNFREDMRGGSSISNQLMEILYTRYVPAMSGRAGVYDGKIEQKRHELPASAMLHWFWSRDEILEAYVNDVFGGYLHGPIIGFRSQAEMYFSRDLHELNLREQMLLVGAVKKPSYIKEYARHLKARELRELLSRPGFSFAQWEDENAAFAVDRGNYMKILKDETVSRWLKNRTDYLLGLLYRDGAIEESAYLRALHEEKIRFDFHPPVRSIDDRLVGNIRRELDQELGEERSDSGLVMSTTIDTAMQRRLQSLIDGEARYVNVEGQFQINGQPASVRLDGGSRIIQANHIEPGGRMRILNRIVADVGGSSKRKSDWDWITMANRSLGSSLKPILDLYFLLEGYNLNDRLRNEKLTYANYTLEQQMSYRNYILKYPQNKEEINRIRKSWSWTPENYHGFTGEWITVKEALVYSVNSVHAQIQEIVSPEIFAELLNQTMNIGDPAMKHTTFRSLVLGGSDGDQRYDKFLLAFSLFANRGVITRQTYIDSLRMDGGWTAVPAYTPLHVPVLEKFNPREVEAAVMLVNTALRETVLRGSMSALRGIGAGKTGTSNDLRDAVATVHFMSGRDTYIAGVRLGNEKNYSIGRAAHEVATPALSRIVRSLFDETSILRGDDCDAVMKSNLDAHPLIARAGEDYYLKKAEKRSRRIDVERIMDERRRYYLAGARERFSGQHYGEAARLYENYLMLTNHFDSDSPEFRDMIVCYIRLGNPRRVSQLIMHFTPPEKMKIIADIYERLYGIDITLDRKLTERLNNAAAADRFPERKAVHETRILDDRGSGKKEGIKDESDEGRVHSKEAPGRKDTGRHDDMHVRTGVPLPSRAKRISLEKGIGAVVKVPRGTIRAVTGVVE